MGDTNLESNFIEVVTIRYAVETQKITDSAYTGIESVVQLRPVQPEGQDSAVALDLQSIVHGIPGVAPYLYGS